ncbi:hypothetical protein BLA3211_08411 [Burkholderia aenigmatica]|uniref:Uncharacterized protein n=1 Tax=Burkholderia aenigmatica TaxID=2015348 RepID=A0A6J5JUI6_9BURK|nr:hypothetical protein [Burkholderia aenigmatica]CAB3975279.1 hypothetical protein BLA3211_08411 [Burkholderia aenigmatica]
MNEHELKLQAQITALQQAVAMALAIANHGADGTSEALIHLRDACVRQWQNTTDGLHERLCTHLDVKAQQAAFDIHFEETIDLTFTMATGLFKSIRGEHGDTGPNNG